MDTGEGDGSRRVHGDRDAGNPRAESRAELLAVDPRCPAHLRRPLLRHRHR